MTHAPSAPSASVTPTAPWSCILFDLDGTITDSAPGIIHRLERTLDALGRPVPSPTQMLRFVGPPILEGFNLVAGMTEPEAIEALAVYRKFADGDGPETEAITYAGVIDVLRDVAAAGVPLAITTSKNEKRAALVLDYLGLTEVFTVITGSSDDESRSAKADVIAEALVRLREKNIDLSKMVMVGDRIHDLEGAAEHGVPGIMVGWGYGAAEEAATAIAFVHTAAELKDALLGPSDTSATAFSAANTTPDSVNASGADRASTASSEAA